MKPDLLALDFASIPVFIGLSVGMFGVAVLRYVLLSGIFHWYFYHWKKDVWLHRKINRKSYSPAQFKKEIAWSMLTAMIFGIIGAGTAVLWQKGYTQIYLETQQFPWYWLPLSIALAMLIHETYYYWLHRWMHQPSIYKWVHKIHHDSKITSAWTAFSFHPIEGLLEALITPCIVCVVPMHVYAVLTHLSIMTLTAVINHLDIEIYPKNNWGNHLGKYMIGATHHSHHHKYYRYNFGLYFTFWDKWAKTESPKFKEEFEQRN